MAKEIIFMNDGGRLTAIGGGLEEIAKKDILSIDNQQEVVENTYSNVIETVKRIESKTPCITFTDYEIIEDGSNLHLEVSESRSFYEGEPRYDELDNFLKEVGR